MFPVYWRLLGNAARIGSLCTIALFIFFAVVLSSTAIAQGGAQSGTFASRFPHYTDSVTGNTVYQISKDPGFNENLYYHQYYSTDPDWVVIRSRPANDWRLIFERINVRTGEATPISTLVANDELIKGDYFYGFNHAASPNYLGRQNLTTLAWTDLYDVPAGWQGIGAVTVNSNATCAIFELWEIGDHAHTRTYLLDLTTRMATLIREEPASNGHEYDHYVFSLRDPDVFTAIDQADFKTNIGLARVLLGTVSSRGTMQPIDIQAAPETYFDPQVFRGANMAHPVWDVDGRLCSDILWHRQSPAGSYGFVCFALSANPLAPIAKSSQELRFIPNSSWNNHFKDAGIPDWFVGDGDLLKSVDHTNANQYVNIMHMTKVPDGVMGYKTDIYNLAQIQGPGEDHANAHLVANRQGAIATFDYGISGQAGRNVFLIAVPTALQQAMQAPE